MAGVEPPVRELIGTGDLATLTVTTHDGALILTVTGEIDISNIDRVAEAIYALPNAEDGLVVDLSAVTYLDSSAVSLLHDLAMRLRNRAQRLVVVATPGTPPRRVLELTALDANAPVVDTRVRAIRLAGDTALP